MLFETAQEREEEGQAIAATFQIQEHRNSDNLHLRLTGVFDEEAALSLIEALNQNGKGVGRIFVHTASLDQVYEAAVNLFQSDLSSLDRPGAEIIFTGKRAEKFVVKAPGIRFIM